MRLRVVNDAVWCFYLSVSKTSADPILTLHMSENHLAAAPNPGLSKFPVSVILLGLLPVHARAIQALDTTQGH